MTSKLTGIVLSAGLSGRMNSFKPLLKLNNGKTFVRTIVDKLFLICDEIIVVTGHKSNEVIKSLSTSVRQNKIKFVFNNNYKSGMFTSLQVGLKNTDSSWYLYHFVDQPSLPNDFYTEFVKQIDAKSNWIQPVLGNRKGHPILLDNKVKELILESSIDSTLRDVAHNELIIKKLWEYNSELIFQDIDTKEDYTTL